MLWEMLIVATCQYGASLSVEGCVRLLGLPTDHICMKLAFGIESYYIDLSCPNLAGIDIPGNCYLLFVVLFTHYLSFRLYFCSVSIKIIFSYLILHKLLYLL